jgi:glycosyltransferase involved in cell wall biosynthesis
MNIAIATGGRFHVLDLARELDAHGQEVAFYSYVPAARAERFGLPRRCQVSVLPVMAPILAAQRLAPRRWDETIAKWSTKTLDHAVAKRLRPCRVLIAMSGLFVETLRQAKDKYSATVILERGNRHILSQDKILRALDGGSRIDPFVVERELIGYEIADFISVPSRHVFESFREYGVPAGKLLLNPYGCDLSMFPPTIRTGAGELTVLFVGTWSRRKGCDVLLQAWRTLKGVRLLHVGPVGDLPLPRDSGFRHVAPVTQQQLSVFYSQADVFALASREDGLALVQAQALASGLPVVCTARTGGCDLRDLVNLPEAVIEVEPGDVAAFASAMQCALDRVRSAPHAPRQWPRAIREKLSWSAYGNRYLMNLASLFSDGQVTSTTSSPT